jgi:hypothetical protein
MEHSHPNTDSRQGREGSRRQSCQIPSPFKPRRGLACFFRGARVRRRRLPIRDASRLVIEVRVPSASLTYPARSRSLAPRPPNKPASAILTRQCRRWYVVFHVEVEATATANSMTVGIDVGLTSPIALSSGEKQRGPVSPRRPQRACASDCAPSPEARRVEAASQGQSSQGQVRGTRHQPAAITCTSSLGLSSPASAGSRSRTSTSSAWRVGCKPGTSMTPRGHNSSRCSLTKLRTLEVRSSRSIRVAQVRNALGAAKSPSRRLPIVGTAVTVGLISIGTAPRQWWCITGLSVLGSDRPRPRMDGGCLRAQSKGNGPRFAPEAACLAGGSSLVNRR